MSNIIYKIKHTSNLCFATSPKGGERIFVVETTNTAYAVRKSALVDPHPNSSESDSSGTAHSNQSWRRLLQEAKLNLDFYNLV
jgi:hypothetical protein